jgi:DNA-binding GntR family transcriptional regulator
MQSLSGRNPEAGGATLAEAIRIALIKDLASGAMRPGHPIDEKALGTRFSTSRTPIREAILQLAAQGFVVMSPRSGASVPKLSIQMLREMLELLGEMEAVAAGYSARRMKPEERRALQTSVDACALAAGADDATAYGRANDDFHQLIYDGCRNGALVEQIATLRTRCAAYTARRFESPGRMQRSVTEHRAVALAIADADSGAAREAMLAHISIGGKDFAEFVSGLPPELLGI